MRKLSLTVVACAFSLQACGIRPLPQDVTRFNTSDIIRHIRCETREAVRNQLLAWLDDRGKYGDPAAARVASDIRARKDVRKIIYDGLKPDTVYAISLFAQTAIAYGFTFDMTVANNSSVNLNVFSVLPAANKGTLGLGGGVNVSRNNIRTLAIADTFGSLYADVSNAYCDNELKDANYLYPITGKIGMEEQISDFIDNSIFNNLVGKDGATSGQEYEADSLDFETVITGSANPKIVLDGGNGLTDASFLGSTTRTDKHKVVIGLSLPVTGKGSGEVKEFVGKFISGTGNATIRRAFRVVDQAKQNELLSKTIILE
ncbi:hypothetical protein [Mesorhizobium sp.]|uniref:hypothetical protein n=1 Tax=Mesorhizobium sp. TaxID=1871066 RepID=UPI00120DE9C8|nr:hypothetical protein [Mesorhizobium sp.]TIR91628.1 MAG: hypothetical protein E5X08_17920 [Mesorhizobium sp.]